LGGVWLGCSREICIERGMGVVFSCSLFQCLFLILRGASGHISGDIFLTEMRNSTAILVHHTNTLPQKSLDVYGLWPTDWRTNLLYKLHGSLDFRFYATIAAGGAEWTCWRGEPPSPIEAKDKSPNEKLNVEYRRSETQWLGLVTTVGSILFQIRLRIRIICEDWKWVDCSVWKNVSRLKATSSHTLMHLTFYISLSL